MVLRNPPLSHTGCLSKPLSDLGSVPHIDAIDQRQEIEILVGTKLERVGFDIGEAPPGIGHKGHNKTVRLSG